MTTGRALLSPTMISKSPSTTNTGKKPKLSCFIISRISLYSENMPHRSKTVPFNAALCSSTVRTKQSEIFALCVLYATNGKRLLAAGEVVLFKSKTTFLIVQTFMADAFPVCAAIPPLFPPLTSIYAFAYIFSTTAPFSR